MITIVAYGLMLNPNVIPVLGRITVLHAGCCCVVDYVGGEPPHLF